MIVFFVFFCRFGFYVVLFNRMTRSQKKRERKGKKKKDVKRRGEERRGEERRLVALD